MKLVAAVITKNELSRYLRVTIPMLADFCDEIRVLDDFSNDGTYEWLLDEPSVYVQSNGGATFDQHEGDARSALLAWVREAEPTHVLAIDADEIVSHGEMFRAALEQDPAQEVWSLEMEEIWNADERRLWVRGDGGWRPHPVPIAWKVGAEEAWWHVRSRALACGREPIAVQGRRAKHSGASILHFGWTNVSERQRRYDRYMAIDGGNFHASRHLQSIMWPPRRIRLTPRPWPGNIPTEMLEAIREERG